jgi:hypothetical protein
MITQYAWRSQDGIEQSGWRLKKGDAPLEAPAFATGHAEQGRTS